MTLYRPPPVTEEPVTEMINWVIMRAYFSKVKTDFSDHVVGWCGEGRASSAIKSFDKDSKIATTRSGRKYHLLTNGEGIMNVDAWYVWQMWAKGNKVLRFEDVTKEYA